MKTMADGSPTRKVALGWKVPELEKDRFVDFCANVGAQYQDSCAGALVAWEYLSPTVREEAIKAATGAGSRDRLIEAMRKEGLGDQAEATQTSRDAQAAVVGALNDAEAEGRKTA